MQAGMPGDGAGNGGRGWPEDAADRWDAGRLWEPPGDTSVAELGVAKGDTGLSYKASSP